MVKWFDAGVKKGATHLIIGWDWFDNDNFPVYVMTGCNARERYDELLRTGNKADEVYDLRLNKESQMNEHRAFHF